MRNSIVLVITLSVIILGGIFENKYLEDTSRYLITDVSYVKNILLNQDIDRAKAYLKDFEEDWNNVKDVWMIFVKHDDIENINDNISKLKSYINVGNNKEAIIYADSLKSSIEYIININKLRLYTVF